VRGTFGEVIEQLRRSTVQVRAHRNGGGSGVIWSQNGRIVTNAHVVEGAGSSAEIELWDGRSVPGRIVKVDRRRDVASLQVDLTGLPAATPGDASALRVGELVIAVGNPLGFTGAASTGVIHRSNSRQGPRGWDERGWDERGWVVSQIRLAPGNSGGPLANARGEVVGINTMIAGGLAFAIPSHSVAEFLGAPGAARSMAQGGLGVVVQPVSVDRNRLGFIVLQVISGSAADRASLLQGDVLVGAGGRRFQSVQDLETAIDASREGVLELQFRRGAGSNLRVVAVRIAPASVRAA
jgi:serine protease Do